MILVSLLVEFALLGVALVLLNTVPVGADLGNRRTLAIALFVLAAFVVAIHTAGASS